MSKSDMPLCQLWCLVTGLNLAQVFKRVLGQHTLIASTIDCQLRLEYNESIRTQFRSDSLQIALANQIESFHVSSVQCLCNKICFHRLSLISAQLSQVKNDSCQYCPKPHFSRVFPNFWRAVYEHDFCSLVLMRAPGDLVWCSRCT